MKYIYLILSTFIIIIILAVLESCKKFVTVDPPYTSLLSTTVFKDPVTATGAQTSVYAQMVNTELPYLMARRVGEYADELTSYAPGDPSISYYTNGLQPSLFNDIWYNSFQYIYSANAVIAGLKNPASPIQPLIKNQLIGEAEFSRAFINFYMVNLFGDIPMPLTTDYKTNGIIGKTAKAQVYDQIIADCIDAAKLLNANFVDATDTTVTTERTRPTKWAADALLARVYLFKGDYVNAEGMASAVIGNTSLFSLNTQLNQVFLANSTESIWQLSYLSSQNYLTEGNNFAIRFGLTTYDTETTTSTISPQLLSAFEAGDNRKTTWIDTYASSGNTYYFPNKYQYLSYGGTVTQYSSVLRLAEQYLIRAEARAKQGNLSDAVNDLNIIRNRAGLANYSGAMDNSSIVNAVLHERQVELFTEWGLRWFDLKRSGQADAVMGVVCPVKGGVWATYKQLWPIMLSDINSDPNLTQNPGY